MLMSKMSHTCKDHGQTVFISCFNRFLVTDRASWLDDGLDTCFSNFFHVIRKWEEGIGEKLVCLKTIQYDLKVYFVKSLIKLI